MTWLVLGALGSSLAVSLAASAGIRRWAPSLGLIDRPGHRKLQREPIPTGGGAAIFLGMLLPLLGMYAYLCMAAALAGESSTPGGPGTALPLPALARTHMAGLWASIPRLLFVFGCGLLLLLLGLADDRWNLPWGVRLAVETAVAILVVYVQGWQLTFFVENPWITRPLTVLWIVWLVNSMNMLDNMDALAGGVAAIAALLLAGVLLSQPSPPANDPQFFVGGFLLLLGGSVLGFLWLNRPPARLYMGDAGAYFVGFALAVGTILATFAREGQPRHAVLAPLCVLAVPIYDTISVVAIRLRERRSIVEGDKSHFSHRLVELGMSRPQAVLAIYLAAFGCGLGALLLHKVDLAGAVVVLGMVACTLAMIAILETVARASLRSKTRRV